MEATIEENVHRLCQQRAAAMDLSAASGERRWGASAPLGRWQPPHLLHACWEQPPAVHLRALCDGYAQPSPLPTCPPACVPAAVKRAAGSKEQGALTVRDVALLLRQPEEGRDMEFDEEAPPGQEAAAGPGPASPRERAAAAAAARVAAVAAGVPAS